MKKKIKGIFPSLKKLIIDNLTKKDNKLFNKILKEIAYISSYLKSNIIEINDIKFLLNENDKTIKNKTKFLLIELLLEQAKTQKQKELYEIIIKLEKECLLNLIKNELLDEKRCVTICSYYNSLKQITIKASELIFKISSIFKDELISFILPLSEAIQIICEQYQQLLTKNKKENKFKEFSFLYNSFIFRTFYFIIEYLIANKIFLKEKENLLAIYKTILILDKITLNNAQNEYKDMNNIIEIRNYKLYNTNDNREYSSYYYDDFYVPIQIKEDNMDIVIETSVINKGLNEAIQLEIVDNNNKTHIFDINTNGNNFVYHKVNEINIFFIRSNHLSNNFVIKIIPLKDENKYNYYKFNENLNIISLILKALIHYLLFLFEDIHSQIDIYNTDKDAKNNSKLYQKELFKFISIPENEAISNDKDNSQIMNILKEKLNNTFYNMDKNFDILNEEFNKINKEMNPNELKFLKN